MKVTKSQPSLLTSEDKKILEVVSRYLNSYGMESGVIRIEVDGWSDSFTRENFSDLSFDNNFHVNPPKILIPILEKIRNYVVNNSDLEINVDDLNGESYEFVIDTKEKEISLTHYWDFYDQDFETIEYNSEDDVSAKEVFNVLKQDKELNKRKYLTLRYNGSGDSGYIESNFEEGDMVPAGVEEWCYEQLEGSYGGWEINEGSTGEFEFDMKNQSIKLRHGANYILNESKTLFEENF